MPLLRRCLLILAVLSLVLAALWLAALAVVKAINWRDDPLTEAAQRALHYEPPSEEELQHNGYLIFSGMDAPAQTDVIATAWSQGRQRLTDAIARRTWAETHNNNDETSMPALTVPVVVADGVSKPFGCPADDSNCLAWFAAHRDEARTEITQHAVLLQRFEAAATAPTFSNPFPNDINVPSPPYTLLLRAHALVLAQAALQWLDSQPDQALATMATASHLRVQLSAHGNSLIDSMVALAMQYRELRWISGAIAQGPMNTRTKQDIAQLLALPSPALLPGIQGETQSAARTYYALRWSKAPLWSPLRDKTKGWLDVVISPMVPLSFLPNRTLNDAVRNLNELAALSTTPAAQLTQAYEPLRTGQLESNNCWRLMDSGINRSWSNLRNFAGECLIVIGMPSYHEAYARRIADVDGYRNLVVLQSHALAAHITAADIPHWLNQSPPELHNPYTLQPMQWDTATNSLVFEGKEPQTQHTDKSSIYRVRFLNAPLETATEPKAP